MPADLVHLGGRHRFVIADAPLWRNNLRTSGEMMTSLHRILAIMAVLCLAPDAEPCSIPHTPNGPCGSSTLQCHCSKFSVQAPSALQMGAGQSGIVDVTIQNFRFTSASVVIEPGTTVRWTNLDSIEHTTTSQTGPGTLVPSGIWNSGAMLLNDVFSFTFNNPGTFSYYCQPHGSGMQGLITVIPEPASVAAAMLLGAVLIARRRGGLMMRLG
ncbi:cupredoxin domain-containing protein [Humisphaera borealis]|uniref:Blue (type 1) copper domain-containing protein n=1 Tax=Humisphaera borealis TaxID=2807512 RepID=A0A7M2WRC0_9BACT|nr:plastocyanin/azurin family copper-binding protein [Humisphaera borealis]QOV87692.1 hypothetical protein IPV69_15510 [Humisphaera borealis]